jgi:hypothetical protein
MRRVLSVPYINLHTLEVTQRYFAFIIATDGSLSLNSSVDGGATWQWRSLDRPPLGMASAVAATAFFSGNLAADGSAINHFYVFVMSNDGHLWVNVSRDDGKSWSWQDQGAFPPGPSSPGSPRPEAVSRLLVKPTSPYGIYCHLAGPDGNLWLNYSEDTGQTWQWANLGMPTNAFGVDLMQDMSSLDYFDGTVQRLYTVLIANVPGAQVPRGSKSVLYANVWDGTTRQWINLGNPGSSPDVDNTPVYLGALFVPLASIFTFVVWGDGHLWSCQSPSGGTGWQWQDHGLPPDATSNTNSINNVLLVGTESKPAGFKWNLFVPAVGVLPGGATEVCLTLNVSPSSTGVWEWQTLDPAQGYSAGGILGSAASSETEASLANVQMYIFVTAQDTDELYTVRWDGTQWTWHDQGSPRDEARGGAAAGSWMRCGDAGHSPNPQNGGTIVTEQEKIEQLERQLRELCCFLPTLARDPELRRMAAIYESGGKHMLESENMQRIIEQALGHVRALRKLAQIGAMECRVNLARRSSPGMDRSTLHPS